jgi:hypothetical protein
VKWHELEVGDVLLPKSRGFMFLVLGKDEQYIIKWVNLDLLMRGATETLRGTAVMSEVTTSYEVFRGSEVFR